MTGFADLVDDGDAASQAVVLLPPHPTIPLHKVQRPASQVQKPTTSHVCVDSPSRGQLPLLVWP